MEGKFQVNIHITIISLMDSEGVKHTIQAFEIDDICGKLNNIAISAVVGLFNNGVSIADVSRRSGSIELLIGMKHVNIFPVPIAEVEGIMLFWSKFGTNLVLGGTDHLLREADTLGETAVTIAHSQIRNTRVMFDKHLDGGIDFFTSEDFGVKLLPKCDHCRNCRNCTYEIHQISKAEQRELKVIENNLILDPVEKRWTTQYPYKQDPSNLGNNEGQVRSLLLKTEKRLSRSEHTCNKYKEQFCDFIDRVVFKELKDEEMRSYRGPVFYVPHHEVYKEVSASTLIRIVINSSLPYNGRSLNDILMKGPNTLNDLFGVQLRFRSYQVAIVCYISKMYHSIRTTEKERHLRRILWRDADENQSIKVYGTEVMMFGDRPVAAIASVALRKTATIYKDMNEEAGEKIIRDSFVDDIATGSDDYKSVELL